MKSFITLLAIIFLTIGANAQRRFIRINSAVDFGDELRIIPTNDLGWIIASMDSLRIARYDMCGKTVWSKKYFLPNEYWSLTDIKALRNGDFVLLNRKPATNQGFCLLTRIDSLGNILWSKSYEDNTYIHYGYSIDEDASGNLFLFAGITQTSVAAYNMVTKVNANGNTIWTHFYNMGGTYGGAIVTTDNGMLFRTGDLFVKIDAAGNIEWSAGGSSPGTYHYTTPLEVSDGYIYTKYKNTSTKTVFYKISKQGVITQNSARVSDYTGQYPRLKLTPAGTIAGIFNQSNKPTLVELDKDLTVLRQGSINYSGYNLYANDFCFSGGEAVVTGTTANGQMFFAKLDDLYKTSCDTSIAPMQLQSDSTTQFNPVMNYFNYNLNELTQNYSSVNVIDQIYTICTVPLELALGPDTTICRSANFLLRNQLLGLFDEYKWSTGSTVPFIHVDQPGTYWLEAKQFCEDSTVVDSVTITFDSIPGLDLGESIIECENSPVVLQAPKCAQCIYEWNTGETTDSLVVTVAGNYRVDVENSAHCSISDSVSVDFALCECELYIPNSFTPNNDGINETFRPVYYCDMTDYELVIFNRMGKVVYTSNNPEEGWTGYYKNSGGIEDIYNYILQYTPLMKGNKTEPIKKTGIVALIF